MVGGLMATLQKQAEHMTDMWLVTTLSIAFGAYVLWRLK
jgi:hypothetical protein